nr:hypothetical protein [Tanacetum cinerariifolium]
MQCSAVTEVKAAMEAAYNEFTRWEVQEREVDENALSIPNKSLFKVITILAEGMFGFYAAMNGLSDYEKKKCNLGVIVIAFVIVFGGVLNSIFHLLWGLYESEQLMKKKRKSVRALLWAWFGCTVFVPIALCVDCLIEGFA